MFLITSGYWLYIHRHIKTTWKEQRGVDHVRGRSHEDEGGGALLL